MTVGPWARRACESLPLHFVAFYVEPTAAGKQEICTRYPPFRPETEYWTLLATMFKSVGLFHPDAKGTLLTDESTPVDLLPSNVAVVRCPVDRDRVVHSRLLAQTEYLRRDAGQSTVFFLDPDVLVNANLAPLAAEEFDVALTYRDLPEMPINDGVIVVKPGPRGVRFMERVRATYDERFAGDPYWFGNQRAVISTLGEMRFLRRRHDVMEVEGTRVRLLPCEQWNFSPEADSKSLAADLRDKRILHFKGDRKWLMPMYWDQRLAPALSC